ncbi:MAG: lysylphosphatidylglycerol synthase domain-containing protein [Planctomycetota bacterium]|nr:lysylphosphatidylglycerol synthase domain-containing protein [Planctomycetota bacterium]
MSLSAHAPRPRRHPLQAAGQFLGFAVGVALLVWCVRGALGPENREQLTRLSNADPRMVAAVIGLSLASLVLNALIFWNAIRPVKQLHAADVGATHAIAVLLGYLPFKLGLLFRFVAHNRRDGVPVLTIGAWFASVTLVMGVVMLPLLGVSLWRGTIDGVWLLAAAAVLALAWGALFGFSRVLAGERGLARVRSWLGVLGSGPWAVKVRGSHALTHLHAGADMLAHPGALGAGVVLRGLDVLTQAARFGVAAHILEIPLSPGQAMLASLAYFVLGIISPAGMLGAREGGTKVALAALDVTGGKGFAVVLLVSAAEVCVQIPAAIAGVLRLRLWRGLRAPAAKDGEMSSTRPLDAARLSS